MKENPKYEILNPKQILSHEFQCFKKHTFGTLFEKLDHWNRISCFMALLSLLLLPAFIHAQTIENPQIFGSEPAAHETSEGRNIASCLKGWRQFVAAGVGFQDFSDYWRDFFLWPSHYADVANVQNQLNRARYAVMAAFLRCDLPRLTSVTEAYYRLEAELYFVRHFVDTDGGYLKVLTESPGSRDKFADEMVDYMILLKPAEDEARERAIYSGYFDLFSARYASRARTYASFGEDPVFEELGAKFDELIEAFKSFKDLGSEMKQLGNEAIVEPATAVGKATAAFFKAPAKSIVAATQAIAKRFDACASTPDNRYCLQGESRTESNFSDPFDTKGGTKPKTFDEVMFAVRQGEVQKTEDTDKAEMRARYEMLYGQVTGGGMKELISGMDDLLAVLGEGREAVPPRGGTGGIEGISGSLEPLAKIQECVQSVKNNVCR